MAQARGQRDADFQRTVELVNRFTVTTVQFLNRFAAMCEEKIQSANRALQNIEVQVKLLEVKLDSTEDSDGESPVPKTAAPSAKVNAIAAPAAPLALTGGPSAPPPPQARGGPPPPPGFNPPNRGHQPPPMSGFVQGGNMPPPPPGSNVRQPPLPPGVAPQGAAPVGQLLALAPPPVPGQPPPGFTPPPPPMPMGTNINNLARNHPRLAGYFKMQDAGVPVAAIKAKMQSDGMNPAWLDAPDGPAPAGIPPLKNDTLYDSD